jgi:DnaJ-class molecular chaperone
MTKNLYETLEIQKTATTEEISKSYKKLAKQYHPDKNQGDKSCAEKFRNIAEAYEILSDPKKKEIYDTHGYDAVMGHNSEQNMHMNMGMNPLDLFAQVMQDFGGFGMQEKKEERENIIVELNVSLEDLYTGKTIFKEVERLSPCKKCNMLGTKDNNVHNCTNCDGKGKILTKLGGQFVKKRDCNECNGSGIKEEYKCSKCKGKKICLEKHTINAMIPAGSHSDEPVIVCDEGHYYGKNQRTDVIFVIIEKEHDKFVRSPDKMDLYYDLEISFVESILGFTKIITHLDQNKFTIQINEPIRHNDKFVVKNYGMNKKKGNLIVNIVVEHPKLTVLTNENKQKIQTIYCGNQKPIKLNPINLVSLLPYELYKEDFKANEAKKHYESRQKRKQDENPFEQMNQPNVRVQECVNQ